MGRRILIVLLVIGAVFGFTMGLRQAWHPHGASGWGRHAEFEAHVADVCVTAARRALTTQGTAASPNP